MTNQDGERSAPDVSWKFLGLQIARKTEFIALAAFVLSLSGVLWQVANYARGAVVRLFPSDQILITNTAKLGRKYANEGNRAAFIATMAYTNDGDTGHNAIIRRERIAASFPGRRVEHQWYEFGTSDINDDGSLYYKREGEARPFPVNAGSALSHETLFAPWEITCKSDDRACDPKRNFLKWDEFIGLVKTKSQVPITAVAEVYGSSPVEAKCTVHLRDWEIKILEEVQWLSAACTGS